MYSWSNSNKITETKSKNVFSVKTHLRAPPTATLSLPNFFLATRAQPPANVREGAAPQSPPGAPGKNKRKNTKGKKNWSVHIC